MILTFNNSLWLDEAFTMLTVKENWSDFWNELIKDVHPPMYYIILKLATSIVGYQLIVCRLLSVLPIFLMNIWIAKLALNDTNRRNDIITGILLSIFIVVTTLTTNFLYMGLEVRMYSWALFFITISGIYAYKTYNNQSKKNIAIFIIMSVFAALTHYFALIAEVIIYSYLYIALFLKDRKNIKQIGLITILTIIGYSWWLPSAISQFTKVSQDFWITFELKNIFGYIKNIFGDNINLILGMILTALVLGIVLYKLLIKKGYEKKKEIILGVLLISMPFAVIIVGTILNIIIRPIFLARYMMPTLGLFWLGIITLMYYADYKKVVIPIACAVILFMVVTAYPVKYKKELKTGTDKTISFMNENLKETDALVTNNRGLNWAVLRFYFPNNDISLVNKFNFEEGRDVIWCFEDKSEDINKEEIKNSGYDIEKVYTGNIDSHYYFNIYRFEK